MSQTEVARSGFIFFLAAVYDVKLFPMFKLRNLSPLFLLALLTYAGCTPAEKEPDPSTIPNIPPSTRASGGGMPGADGVSKGSKLDPPGK